ncbi:glycosyltransferase family 2 protein [Amaricoccus sp.]|uniref:glycosyltransferase family 2 protein n=1 Tax=Amaricoccus sp. TaxID=1872485 RepID=UPI001B700651|nr:glycosyltransferase family 2 protein [Amaricoccus sp.]MBP7002763.1 glycosyltransferase family 2 protein [Amaricoccus sp.]
MIAPTETISVVIPVLDEAEGLERVLGEVLAALGDTAAEVIVVDDGSTDATPGLLADLAARERRLRVLTHARPAGQSSAIRTGVRAARCSWVATLDGDGQNPPDQILVLLEALHAAPSSRVGLVQGERRQRRDRSSRRWGSRAANAIRATVLGDGVRDSACGLKVFRRSAFLELPYFEHMHRFVPALMRREGWDVVLVPVEHRPRLAGRSHYSNLRRALVGIVDLAGVAWLLRRRTHTVVPGRTISGAKGTGCVADAHTMFVARRTSNR